MSFLARQNSKNYTRCMTGQSCFTILFALVLIFCASCLFGQETPPLISYAPSLYKAHNQNWSVSQSNDGLLYFANSDGLLEYDGSGWKLYPLPDRQIVRTVLCDDKIVRDKTSRKISKVEHRIYVGGFTEFGYWVRKPDGQLIYHSLSKQANLKSLRTEEIWHILKTPDYIYFQSFSKLYRYDGKILKEIKGLGNFMFLRSVRNRLIIQMIGKGLYELKEEKFFPVKGTDILAQSIVSAILPFSNNRILITTTKQGLYILDKDTLTPWNINISGELKHNLLNKATILTADSSYVFGTIQKGIYVVSANGLLKYKFNKENGLQNNTVLALGEDNRKNLWLGLDQGIDLIKMSSPVVSYQTNDNPLGTTYAAAVWRDNLYVGSNNGVFVKKWKSAESFRPIPGLGGQTWNLKVFNDQLICGHNDATFRIEENKITRISDITGGWVLLPLYDKKDTVLLQGSYTGLHIYKRNNKKEWNYARAVKGVPPLPIRHIVQDNSGSLWLCHAYKGLYRTKLSENLDSAIFWKEYKAPQEIPSDFSVEVVKWRNSIYIRSGNKFFKADENGRLTADKSLGVANEETYKLRTGSGQDWFKVFPSRIDYYRGNIRGNIMRPIDLSLIRNNETIISLSEQVYFFCLDNGYALYNRMQPLFSPAKEVKPMIRKVANLRNLLQTFDIQPQTALPADVRSIRISYTTPVYGQNVLYKYRLTGLTEQWSEWTDQNFVEFTNLESTPYAFEIKSNLNNSVLSYTFSIKPYWYETGWAKSLFATAIIALFIALLLYQEKRLSRHRKKLIREQEERLHQQKLSSERKIMQLQNEKLQSEIRSKSQQISNVAINVVRKNEILEEIRDELKQVKEEMGQQLPNNHYQKLLNSIERNVAGKEDWVLFEENFNEVHEEFFKKLKKICPSVSPSELRLAACLRMNLSTKEMAPALGISARGVEIKRYRLRKKLGLEADSNLAEYMMEI